MSRQQLPAATRAVETPIEAGNRARCAHCGVQIKFQAKNRVNRRQVVCNVYLGDRWDRVEHFHTDCYDDAGAPHGPILSRRPTVGFARPRKAATR